MKHFFVSLFILYNLSVVPSAAQEEEKAETHLIAGEGNGLRADYYKGPNFEEKIFSRIEEKIDFYYHFESPIPGVVPEENYSIRWTGTLYAPVTGTYKIIATVDDGVRLWVNGEKLLDKWKLQQVSTYYNTIHLKGGEYYSLKIEYFNSPEYAIMKLMWESPEDRTSFFGFFETNGRKLIPTKYLYGKPQEVKPAEKQVVLREEVEEVEAPVRSNKQGEKSSGKENVSIEEKSRPEEAEEVNQIEEEENTFGNLKPGEVVQFRKVWFEQGKYDLLEESFPELDKLARTLRRYPRLGIRIEGHTDNVGDPRLNQSLSLYRAKAVATYLLEHGIEPFRIEAEGYGDSRPLADNSTEAGRSKNRRVEFVVK